MGGNYRRRNERFASGLGMRCFGYGKSNRKLEPASVSRVVEERRGKSVQGPTANWFQPLKATASIHVASAAFFIYIYIPSSFQRGYGNFLISLELFGESSFTILSIRYERSRSSWKRFLYKILKSMRKIARRRRRRNLRVRRGKWLPLRGKIIPVYNTPVLQSKRMRDRWNCR